MTIWALLRKFRRSYLSASKVYKKLGKLGPLSLQIDGHKVEGEGFQVKAENQVPDTDLITQLAIPYVPTP